MTESLPQTADYELLDCGDYRRLERFGAIILDRPAPQASWSKKLSSSEWSRSDLFYERSESAPENNRWLNPKNLAQHWPILLDNLKVELRLSANNQVGLFPEQLTNWRWLHQKLQNTKSPLRLLNGFAYTGAATLFASSAHPDVEICHLDGASSSVKWAQHNAQLSQLQDRKIRWIVDDVLTFLQREIKRGQKYHGFIFDPPAFGRGKGFSWKLERDLPRLIECIDALLVDDPSFVILSCHAPEFDSKRLRDELIDLKKLRSTKDEHFELTIPSKHGNSLPCGVCARFSR